LIKEKIGIIGLGNMGGALARGLKKSGIISPRHLLLFDIDKNRLDSIAEESGFEKALSNKDLVSKSQGIVLAVKPQDVAKVLEETAESWTANKFIISIAAGISISFLEKRFKKQLPVIRAMPNTPGQIGAGITAISSGSRVDSQYKELARNIFRAFGAVVEVDEKEMDLVTALSGSGPAYFFLLMEGLIEAGKTLGLKELTAESLVKETALGAAKLAKEAPQSLSQLREKVTSPGGTTEAALKVLKKADIKKIIFEAVEAARSRSKQLRQT